MPEFLEKKLKQQYGDDSDVPFKIMNAKGSKETAKGRAAQAKHDAKIGNPKKRGTYRAMLEKMK